jgi:hypothetical protein
MGRPGLPAAAELADFSRRNMPVGHFTFHAFGTWWPDNPRGYVQRGEGIHLPDSELADDYRDRAAGDPVKFDQAMQRVIIVGAANICRRRGWRLHAVGNDDTHTHQLISAKEYFDFQAAQDKIKNLLSLFLGRLAGIQGRQWFAAGGSHKRVTKQDHFDYLVGQYFPDHRGEFWKEGDPLPQIPPGIL